MLLWLRWLLWLLLKLTIVCGRVVLVVCECPPFILSMGIMERIRVAIEIHSLTGGGIGIEEIESVGIILAIGFACDLV